MSWAARFVLAAVLIGAGVLKAADPVPVLPQGWWGGWSATWMIMRLLPWIEILAGLLLFSELPVRWTAWPAVVLFLGFVAVTLLRLVNEGPSADCGCFGVLAAPLDQWHLVGNVVLLGLAGWLAWNARRGAVRVSPSP